MIGYGTLKKLILTIQPFKPLIHFDSKTSMLSFTCFYNDMFGRNTLYHIVTGPQRAWHTHGQFLCIAKIGTLKPIILIRILTANCGGSGGYLSTHFSCMIKWQQTRSLLDRINPQTSVTDYTYLWWLPRNKIFNPKVSMSAFLILKVPHSMRSSYFPEPLTNTTLYLQSVPQWVYCQWQRWIIAIAATSFTHLIYTMSYRPNNHHQAKRWQTVSFEDFVARSRYLRQG